MCFCASQDGCQGGDLNTPWQYLADQGLSVGGKSIKSWLFFFTCFIVTYLFNLQHPKLHFFNVIYKYIFWTFFLHTHSILHYQAKTTTQVHLKLLVLAHLSLCPIAFTTVHPTLHPTQRKVHQAAQPSMLVNHQNVQLNVATVMRKHRTTILKQVDMVLKEQCNRLVDKALQLLCK